MTEVISMEDVGYSYRPGTWLFRHYNATIKRGQVLAILGPNGSGKTTLLKLLLGVFAPSEGTLNVGGTMALVPQLFQVSFDYTALDMVLMGRARRIGLFSQPDRADREAALEALDRFGMADLASRPFQTMSGGQRQLVIFARALVAGVDVLLLDEPTSALDLKNQVLILDWIGNLAECEDLTVVMTTHHPHHALAVADRALLMLGEEEYEIGPSDDVLTEATLSRLYATPLKKVAFDYEGRAIKTFAQVL